MPRNFSKYQYETSPRKLEPEYAPKKNNYKGKKSTTRKVEQKINKKKLQEERKQHRKVIMYVALAFSLLFAISYRNAQIDENFEKVQDYKKELAAIEKENSQLQNAARRVGQESFPQRNVFRRDSEVYGDENHHGTSDSRTY